MYFPVTLSQLRQMYSGMYRNGNVTKQLAAYPSPYNTIKLKLNIN